MICPRWSPSGHHQRPKALATAKMATPERLAEVIT